MTTDHDHDNHDHDDADAGRVTSPMQSFTTGQVGVGLAVLAVGVAVAYLLPYALV